MYTETKKEIYTVKRVIIRIFSFALICLLIGLNTQVYAADPAEYGVVLTKGDFYSKDNKYYMPFILKTGQVPYADDPVTTTEAVLVDSGGKTLFSWKRKKHHYNETVDWKPNFSLADLPSDKYTMKVTVGIWDSSLNYYAWTWSYKISHNAASSVWLDSVTLISRDDGSYANKIILGHSNAKGKTANIDIYDEYNNLVYSDQGNKISYNKGTYYFNWGGFSNDGGVQCPSGNYRIKFWINGGNPKQSDVWLDIL